MSRKLAAGVVAILLIALNNRLGLGLDAGQLDWIGTLALSVIGSQGAVDVLRGWRDGQCNSGAGGRP